jgi:hypothetical protein
VTDQPSQSFAGLDLVNHVSEFMTNAPRLSRALLDGPVGSHDAFRTKLEKTGSPLALTSGEFDGRLAELLQHVEERLKNGLFEAWIAPQAYDWRRPAGEGEMSRDEAESLVKLLAFWSSPEEAWARAFTEMVLFTMYGGTGQTYFTSENKDRPFFEAFPRVYPIALACQHLSTMCILSRGFPIAKLSKSFAAGCGCTGSTTTYDVFIDKVKFECGKPPEGKDFREVSELVKIPLGPGDVVIYNPGGPETLSQDHGKTTHIASVLRTSGRRIQFIDTGVLTGDDERGGEGGTVDHSFATRSIERDKSLIGWAKIPEATDLAGFTTKVAASQPLGVVRFALLDVSDQRNPEVRFVSKLLHMRFPVSRLLWSLRGLPVEDLVALWYVYVPRYKWGEALLQAPEPNPAPAQLFTADFGGLYLANVLVSAAAGKAHVYRNKAKEFIRDCEISGVTKDPAMARSVPLALTGAPSLETWCMDRKTFGKRYVRKPGEDQGTVDEGGAGVAFFDQ